MSTIQTTTPAVGATPSAKEQFLDTYDREHKTTMRVLRAYPQDKLDLRPHEKCKSAWELAWVFVAERGLGTLVFQDAFAKGGPTGDAPSAPDSWEEILAALEQAHAEFGDLVRSTPEDKLGDPVKFFTGPKTMGDVTRSYSGSCCTTRFITAGSSPSTCAWPARRCPPSTDRRRTSPGCRR